MCGIFGYTGKRVVVETVLQGLKRLEYRGYDSAGIAGLHGDQLLFCKQVGKIDTLQERVQSEGMVLDLAIAHTRWATHGKPSDVNAHPHFDASGKLALVHNGIIENEAELKQELKKKGIAFTTDTDTEVIAKLIGWFYEGDLLRALKTALPLLKGAFALAMIHEEHPGKLIAVARQSPLLIGVGKGETFLSSDANAFASYTREVIPLSEGEVAILTASSIQIFNASLEMIEKERHELDMEIAAPTKGSFAHYTLKEIFEQPQAARNALLSHCDEEQGVAIFPEFRVMPLDAEFIQRLLIIACGTSFHAGLIASYSIEEMARIPVTVEIASEFRYKQPLILPGTLVVAISQSGETADTLAAVRLVKAQGFKVIGLCNVQGSTLAREADETIFLKAGPEVGVCSTKAFTSQLTVLTLLSLFLARYREMSREEGQRFIKELYQLPNQIQRILDQSDEIERIAKKYAHLSEVFFIGRNLMYPAALEAALKLKEISYINANAYPGGELKHGPLALISPESLLVALTAHEPTFDKIQSNIQEVKARGAAVLAICYEGEKRLEARVEDQLFIPRTRGVLTPILTTVALQLFAYYIAKERGASIDQPRNLAKSVSVE